MDDRDEEEQDTDLCLWLKRELGWGEAEEWPNNQLWKKNITLMQFRGSWWWLWGKLARDKRWVSLFLPLYRPSNVMPALQILLSAYCHSNRKRNRWSLSVRRLSLSPSTWAFASCCDSPRAILIHCHGVFRPLTVCLWGPGVLVGRPTSLNFHFSLVFAGEA